MIFWILIVICSAATLWALVYFWFLDDVFDGLSRIVFGLLCAFLTAASTGLISLGIIALFSLIPAGHVRHDTYSLASLGSTQGVSGEFYLGTGYINGTREIAYVKQLDGYSIATEAVGDSSRIFQDATKPTVIEYTYFYSNGWVLPFNYDTGNSYDFHVPAGTIQNNYQIGNN